MSTIPPDGEYNIISGFERLVELFPDGPPTEEVASLFDPARMLLAATVGVTESLANIVQIDNDRQYYIQMPTGTQVRADRRSRNHWSLVVVSPPSPSGKTIKISKTVPGGRTDITIAIAQLAEDINKIRRGLIKLVADFGGLSWDEVPVKYQTVFTTLAAPNELAFDGLYDGLNNNPNKFIDPGFEGFSKEGMHAFGVDILLLTIITLHEVWIDMANAQFEEDKKMAKNSGGMVWWELTGGRTSLNKLVNSLTHNRHFVVLDTDSRVFLRVQNSEQRFVDLATGRFNCRAKLVDEPEYGETLCGKYHHHPVLHQKRCNACARVKTNNARAEQDRIDKEAAELQAQPAQSTETKVGEPGEAEAVWRNKKAVSQESVFPPTVSPDGVYRSGLGSTLPRNPIIPPPYVNEQKEWAAKNGPVITIAGPAAKESNDIQGLAEEYRRVSDELMERASYYATLAEKYELLLQPTDAVKDAEAALAAARATEQKDREDQIAALQELLAAGPPA